MATDNDFQSWSVDDLRAEVTRILSFTAESIHRLAMVVAELERRGETLDDLDTTILPILRLVAAGTLLPEIVVKYAGQVRLLLRASKLTVEDQRRVLSGELDLAAPRKRAAPNTAVQTREQIPSDESARPHPDPLPPQSGRENSRPSSAPTRPAREGRDAGPALAPSNAGSRDLGDNVASVLLASAAPKMAFAFVVDRFAERGLIDADLARKLTTELRRSSQTPRFGPRR